LTFQVGALFLAELNLAVRAANLSSLIFIQFLHDVMKLFSGSSVRYDVEPPRMLHSSQHHA
jgi:hypothetical protein